MLRVGVTIKRLNKHLQNWLIFRVWIIWGGTKRIGGNCPRMPPRGYGPYVIHRRTQFSKVSHTTHAILYKNWSSPVKRRYIARFARFQEDDKVWSHQQNSRGMLSTWDVLIPPRAAAPRSPSWEDRVQKLINEKKQEVRAYLCFQIFFWNLFVYSKGYSGIFVIVFFTEISIYHWYHNFIFSSVATMSLAYFLCVLIYKRCF